MVDAADPDAADPADGRVDPVGGGVDPRVVVRLPVPAGEPGGGTDTGVDLRLVLDAAAGGVTEAGVDLGAADAGPTGDPTSTDDAAAGPGGWVAAALLGPLVLLVQAEPDASSITRATAAQRRIGLRSPGGAIIRGFRFAEEVSPAC